MTHIGGIGKMLITAGVVLILVGLALTYSGRIPWLGRLPGDIVIRRKGFTLYFPLATGLLISVVLSVILWLTGRR